MRRHGGGIEMCERSDRLFSLALIEAQPRLRKYAMSLLRHLRSGKKESVEDLVQQVNLRAWAYRDRFAEGSNMPAWVATLMHNEWASTTRNTTRRARSVGAPPAPTDSPEDATIQLIVRDVERAMRHLDQGMIDALRLITYEGLSYEDAAERLQIPVGTVRSRLARGRERLRDLSDWEQKRPARPSHPYEKIAPNIYRYYRGYQVRVARKFIGTFATEAEAIAARDAAKG